MEKEEIGPLDRQRRWKGDTAVKRKTWTIKSIFFHSANSAISFYRSTKKGFPLTTDSVAAPPMLSVDVDFVVKAVVDGDLGARLAIDAIHVLLEFRTMT